MLHSEIVLRSGEPVGEVRAASYGHSLGASVGLAMVRGDPVDADDLEGGDWAVDIAGRVYPAEVSLRSMYDPEMARVRSQPWKGSAGVKPAGSNFRVCPCQPLFISNHGKKSYGDPVFHWGMRISIPLIDFPIFRYL